MARAVCSKNYDGPVLKAVDDKAKGAFIKTIIMIAQCPICQKVRRTQRLKYISLYATSRFGIFDKVSINCINIPESSRNNKYILTFIDTFGRYLDSEVYPISDLSAITAFHCFIQYCGNYGIPFHICTDKETQFYDEFHELVSKTQVEHTVRQSWLGNINKPTSITGKKMDE